MATKRKAEYIIPQDEQIDLPRMVFDYEVTHRSDVLGTRSWNNEGQIFNSAPGVIDWPYMRARTNPGMTPEAWEQAVVSVYGPAKTPIYGGGT